MGQHHGPANAPRHSQGRDGGFQENSFFIRTASCPQRLTKEIQNPQKFRSAPADLAGPYQREFRPHRHRNPQHRLLSGAFGARLFRSPIGRLSQRPAHEKKKPRWGSKRKIIAGSEGRRQEAQRNEPGKIHPDGIPRGHTPKAASTRPRPSNAQSHFSKSGHRSIQTPRQCSTPK